MRRAVLSCLLAIPAAARAADDQPFVNPGFRRVMVVVLENADYKKAVRQPFLAGLMKRGATLTDYHAITHPSQPNYVALIGGDTLGIVDDSRVDLNDRVRHLGDLLEAKGKTWAAYAEDYPGHCFYRERNGRYARKHEPFMSFLDVVTVPHHCAKVKDAAELDKDLAADALPDFSLYTPGLDNDGHDTDVAYADRWLKKRFGPLLDDPEFMGGMLFVVTFDEDSGTKGNRILTVLVGDTVKSGVKSSTRYDHYSLLRTIEDAFKLGTLGRHDARASPIDGIWRTR